MFNMIRTWLLIVPWLIGGAAWAADPSVLWQITDGKCIPDMRENNDPAPCSVVDLNAGYVVLKDINGATQFLLMPTARIGGIESPEILSPKALNYWDRAWRMRTLSESRAGKPLPREAISLAINSAYGRTQDQLHIHIDCVRRDVHDALLANRGAIGSQWSEFPVPLVDLPWRAIRVNGANLGTVNPFRLLAAGDPDAAADMGKHTLVVVGMTWEDKGTGAGKTAGFVVLDGKVDVPPGNHAAGEMLQDHGCALAH